MNVLIIGGVACGPKAAARIHRLQPDTRITLIEKGELLSYAGCGIPYYISGQIRDIKELMKTNAGILRDSHYFQNFKGVTVRNLTVATRIDPQRKEVEIFDIGTMDRERLSYDKLVIATGGQPIQPDIPGRDLKGVYTLHNLTNAKKLREQMQQGAKRAVIIGGGAIGIEIAEAFTHNDLETHLVEAKDQVMAKALDREMCAMVTEYLNIDEVNLHLNSRVVGFEGDEEGHLRRVLLEEGSIEAEIAIIAIGTRPNAQLAAEAGLAIGASGAIQVNEHLQTSDPDIYAGGDCVENLHRITGKPVYIPMGDTANKHGRVIANHLCGYAQGSRFPGVLGTGIYKYGDLSIGHSGLTERQARADGYACDAILYPGLDKPEFCATARRIDMKLIFEQSSRRLLGVQLVGEGDVSKRLDVLATAMSLDATLDQLSNLDLGYAPPYSPALDNVISAANISLNKLDGISHAVSPVQLWKSIQAGEDLLVVDVRTQREFAAERMDLPQLRSIPLSRLLGALESIPRDKPVITLCKVGLRGYEACQLLRGKGFANAFYLEGGLAMWSHPKTREPL
ncbi:MAG: FAD-dependent oxidoreductase [Magnetococcus sp. MYC-9]